MLYLRGKMVVFQAQQLKIKYNASRDQASDVLNLPNVTLTEDLRNEELNNQQQITITSNITVNSTFQTNCATHQNLLG